MHRNPETADMLGAVAAFLRDACAPALQGRDAFMARVAANAVEIAERELRLGPLALAAEGEHLRRLLDVSTGEVAALRAALCESIRAGALDEHSSGLVEALLSIAAERVRIEQPNYASLRRVEQ